MPVDPRLGGVVLGITDPSLAALATLRQEVADLRREVRDLRSAATIQVVTAVPAGSSRDGAPAGNVATSQFLLRLGGQWKGVTLGTPL